MGFIILFMQRAVSVFAVGRPVLILYSVCINHDDNIKPRLEHRMFNPNILLGHSIRQPALSAIIQLLARMALAAIFIVSGWGKLSDYAGTMAYMQAMQVSSSLLPLVIFAELGGGLAILLGFQTRIAALGLAIFSVLTAVLFHVGGTDAAAQYNNSIHFMKNIGLAGGFLALLLLGAGRFSIDDLLERNEQSK